MPTLNQLISETNDPTVTQIVDNSILIEPLDGPTSPEDVFDHFPEETYQQGRDSHLFRLLTALGGNAGAGFLKLQAFAARLKFEAEFLNFQILDEYYAAQFKMHRLRPEVYDFNPGSALTPDQWDDIQLADQSYRHRVQEFFTAVRYGTAPQGMATMAQAGSGIDSDCLEHYRYIFDQYADLQLGLAPQGITVSTNEFVVQPRFLSSDLDVAYEAPWHWAWDFTAPTFNTGVGRPVPTTAPLTVERTFVAEALTALVPEIERNVLNLLDRLRPVGTLTSVDPQGLRYTEVPTAAGPIASSERLFVSRFVTGNPDVVWPDFDPAQGFFIEPEIERETTSFYGGARELPMVFETVEGILSYTERALLDPTYGSAAFYPAAALFASVHFGQYLANLQAIFPFLSQVALDDQFPVSNALAFQDTPLILEGNPV